MHFKRQKKRQHGDLDRWSLPKRVKIEPTPESIRVQKKKKPAKICAKTKGPHEFELVEDKKFLFFRFLEKRCKLCNKRGIQSYTD